MTRLKSEPLHVRQLALGPMKNFVYLLGDGASDEVAVVDPAWDAAAIRAAAQADGKRLSAIIVSHHHGDHVNGVEPLLAELDLPVYVQRSEHAFSDAVRFGDAVRLVGPGEVIRVGGLEVELIHTPGHTPGSQCVHARGALFSGDTVFVNACGRCDFKGGDPEAMHHSLHRVLGALDDGTRLYPGHDYGDVQVSSLGRERAQNPYFQLKALPDFVAHRMRPRT